MSENKLDKVYYGLSQYCHGAEHRFIYDEDTLKELLKEEKCEEILEVMKEKDDVFDFEAEDIGFPIRNHSSATWFYKIKTLEDADLFLSMACETEYEDPELIDVAEYYMSIETKETNYGNEENSTDYILELLGKTPQDYNTDKLPEVEEIEKQIELLKQAGYKDFDYERPFYGENKSMRVSELHDLVEEQTKKTDIFQKISELEENEDFDLFHDSCANVMSDLLMDPSWTTYKMFEALLQDYQNGNEDVKKGIDLALTSVTGFSLESIAGKIIEQVETDKEFMKDMEKDEEVER